MIICLDVYSQFAIRTMLKWFFKMTSTWIKYLKQYHQVSYLSHCDLLSTDYFKWLIPKH